ncbi:MAG: peptidylprolyl isomerase [Pyrinomonadaceae bacterium]
MPSPSKTSTAHASNSIPDQLMLRTVRAEDERRWDADVASLLTDESVRVRRRAALAAGRIGDERAVAPLVSLLRSDTDVSVRAMAAFALGEIEAAAGAFALTEALRASPSGEVRARAIEALGKIAAALPKTEEARQRALGDTLLEVLTLEAKRAPQPDRAVVLEGLTAVLRAHPANAGLTLALFLSNPDARIRADAANALARLRAKNAGEQLRALLQQDADAIVRANAARALGAAEDRASFDALVNRSVNDADERVRVSAIRALGSLKDARAATALIPRAESLFALYRTARVTDAAAHPSVANELLEIAATLGRVLASTNDARAVTLLRGMREAENFHAPEIEIAFAHIAPAVYLHEPPFDKSAGVSPRAKAFDDWRAVASIGQGLAEIAKISNADAGNSAIGLKVEAQTILRTLLDDTHTPVVGVPEVLRAFVAFKPNDWGEVLRNHLNDNDVMVRATVAELLGEGAKPDETNTRSLAAALPVAMRDEMNDAALAILGALAKQKTAFANDSIKLALASTDHLLRRRAVALLKANDAGDFNARIGTVATRNTAADYARALARNGKLVRAIVATEKGNFTIELLPDDAPLTVDSFVQLARRGFFNNIDFHRVVPNFVIQGGDPRGDGNGGPEYQIRCEINEAEYDRGAVGMALSGKDTGGSQWFVTHSPQPHLDGGYTVFGRAIDGMNIVDRIARGDKISSVTISESEPRPSPRTRKAAPATVVNGGGAKQRSKVKQ